MADIIEIAAKQADAPAPGAEAPVTPGMERDDQGRFVHKEGEKKPDSEKVPDQESNWKAIRKELKSLKEGLGQKDTYIQKLQEREDKLLELLAAQKRTVSEESEDPWAHLPKDDPDRPLLEKKLAPALKSVLSAAEKKAAKLEAEIAELRKAREQDTSSQSDAQKYRSALSDFIEAKELGADAATAINEVIRSGKVGGEDFEDAFDNALTYLKGMGKTFKGAKAPKTNEERTSVGGIMPGSAGAPVLSDDYKTLRKTLQTARANKDFGTEEQTFQHFFQKMQEEQGRG